MKLFRPWTINEQRLVPVALEDYLGDDHSAIWIRDIVFELTRVDVFNWRCGSDGGRPAYHPSMMLAVLILAYMRGVRSSRRIQRLLIENIAFRVISGEQVPNFRTLAAFRQTHHALLQKVFTRVVLLALDLRMIDLGAVIVDGTIFQANASKKRSRRFESLKKLEAQELEARKAKAAEGLVERLLEEARLVDENEDQQFGSEGYPDPVFAPAKGLGPRIERIQEAIRRVEASERQREGRIHLQRTRLIRLAWERPRTQRAEGWKVKKRRKTKLKRLSKVLEKLSRVSIPRKKRGNTTDPQSRRMAHPQTGGYVQGHRILRATDANSGLILETTVATETGESRGLPGIIQRAMMRMGMPQLLRVVVDRGFAGAPNLLALDKLKVHEVLIPQLKTSKRSERIREAKRLVSRRRYWMKKRKRIESGFGHTKENKGLRRLLLRGIRGAEIEMLLDAIGFNFEKIAAKFKVIPKDKIKKSLALASQLGF